MRALGDITTDMEPLLLEMTEDHELQWHEILGLVYAYLEVHCPGGREEYEDGTSPRYKYGP